MKHRLLAAAVVFALLLVVGAVLTLQNPGGGEETPVPVDHGGAAPDVVEAPAEFPTPETTVSTDAQVPEEEPVKVVRAEVGRPVNGRVVLPDGVPADEEVEVVLQRHSSEDRRTVWWDDPYDLREIGRTTIDGAGGFRLTLPEGSVPARLVLDARYVYLEEPYLLEDPAQHVTLEAQLGGALLFRLIADPEGRHDPRSLVGQTVNLQVFASGFVPEWPFEIDENLEILAGGLRRPDTYALLGDLPPFVRFGGSAEALPGETNVVEVPLVDGIVVSGRVVDDEGNPVAEARVEGTAEVVRPDGESWTETSYPRERRTEEEGRFRFDNCHPGLTKLVAEGNGFLAAEVSREGLGPGPDLLDVEIVLSRGLSLEGIVRLPDGRTVADASVTAHVTSDRSRFPMGHIGTQTDDAGRFRLSGLSAGAYDVLARASLHVEDLEGEEETVTAKDRWNEAGWTVERLELPAGTTGIELVLQEPPGLEGVVVDESGVPVAMYRLVATPDRGLPSSEISMSLEEYYLSVESEDGRFRWENLSAGKWLIRVHAAGFGRTAPRRVELPGDGEPLRVVLSRAASVEGIVLDPDGRPFAGARVDPILIAGESRTSLGGLAENSGEDGRFMIEGIDTRRVELTATAEGFAASETVEVDLSLGAPREEVILRLSWGGRLVVEVLGADGSPLDYVPVRVRDLAFHPLRREVETDATGRVELELLRAGEYDLTAYPKSDRPGTLDGRATVREGATTQVTLGGPEAFALVVTGVVTSGGEPANEARVSAWPWEDREAQAFSMTGSDGRFTLDLKVGGWVLFRVFGGGESRGQFFEVELPRSGAHELSFDLPTGGMRGRLEVPGGGELPFGFHVVVERRPEGGPAWTGGEIVTLLPKRTSGGWSCRNLPPGRYRVFASTDPRFGTLGRHGVYAPALLTDVLVREGEITEGVDLVLGPSGVVEGLVRDPDGRPVPGVIVYARDASGILLHPSGHRVDARGRFSFGNLPTGRVLLEALGAGLATPAPRPVELVSDEVVEQDLELVPATLVTLELEGVGEDRTGVALSLRDSAGLEHGQLRGFDLYWYDKRAPRRTFGPLPPGKWHAVARLPDGRTVEVDFELTEEEERTVVLDLSR